MNEAQLQMTAGTATGTGSVQRGGDADLLRAGHGGLDTGARGWRWLPPRGAASAQMQAGSPRRGSHD